MWPTAIPVGKPRSTQAALHGPEPRASRTCTALEAQPGPLPQASEYGCPGWGLKDRLIGPRSGQNLRSSDSHGHQQVRPKGRKSVAGWLVQGLEEQRRRGGQKRRVGAEECSSAGGRAGSGRAVSLGGPPEDPQLPDSLFGEEGCTGRLTQQVHEDRVAQQQ